jgi:secondary thiamine-phosphate synthase enzyme
MVKTYQIKVQTTGNCQVVNLTDDVTNALADSGVSDGVAVIFNIGSTAGVTTLEYEPGLVNYDIAAAMENIAPCDGYYEHEKTWNDDNGHAHVRAALLGPSLSIPIIDDELTLGTWQQIVLIDFDTRPRERTVILQVLGTK